MIFNIFEASISQDIQA